MKINARKKSYKKPLLAALTIIVLASLGYLAYAKTQDQWPFKTDENASQTSTNNNGATDDSDTPTTQLAPDTDGVNSDSSNTPTTSPKTPTENEKTGTPSSKDSVGVTITSAQNVGSDVRVRTLIEAVTSSGSCTLTFEKNGKTVRQTSGIQALASSSTCKGFTVPKSQLSSGVWHITLNVITSGKSGKATKDYRVS